jgi:hypothetical protein
MRRSRRRCRVWARFSRQIRCRDQTLVGKLHIVLLASIHQPQSPAHLSLDRVPICARLSWYLYIFNTSPLLTLLAVNTAYSFLHCLCWPLFYYIPSRHPSRPSLETSAKFFSTAYRHPHASIDDGLHSQSFLHCLLNRPAHPRAQFSRHVLYHGLYHLHHNRES